MKTPLTVLFVLFLCGPATAQDLPPDILADQYLLEATKALENGDTQGALRAFGKIEALDTEPPLEFLFFYGKLLVENRTSLDDLLKGQSLLKQFVLNIDKDSEHYTPTLELLSVVGTKLEKAEAEHRAEQRRQAEEVRRAEAERQRLAKLKEQLPQLLANLQKQMVHVRGGTFTRGCVFEQGGCFDTEAPTHRMRVGGFEISKYEVTQALWEAVMGTSPSRSRGCAQCPVENVSWNDTQEFLKKLNELTGKRYRLPTEAEWEYAAQGGQQGRGYEYAGNDNLGTVAWYEDNSGAKTHPVGRKQANELGLYDLSGNVSEWVQDCWNRGCAGAPSNGRAWESGNCSQRVLRGGSWSTDDPRFLRSAYRSSNAADYQHTRIGFRIARSLP